MVKHVLRDCSLATLLWLSSLGIRTTEFSRLNVQEWLIHLAHVSSTPTFELSLMILWMISKV